MILKKKLMNNKSNHVIEESACGFKFDLTKPALNLFLIKTINSQERNLLVYNYIAAFVAIKSKATDFVHQDYLYQ